MSLKTHNIKHLERLLHAKEYVKILQLIGTQYESLDELFFVVESYIGLERYDLPEKLLINWQSKLTSSEQWAQWCYLYAKCLLGMKKNKEAFTTLKFASDFLKTLDNVVLKKKIENLQKEIESIL